MIIAGLALVLLKMAYNVVSFVYDTQYPALERYFNIGVFVLIMYYAVSVPKKLKAKRY